MIHLYHSAKSKNLDNHHLIDMLQCYTQSKSLKIASIFTSLCQTHFLGLISRFLLHFFGTFATFNFGDFKQNVCFFLG